MMYPALPFLRRRTLAGDERFSISNRRRLFLSLARERIEVRVNALMKTKDNTILITGGGSGIGRALAEAFHRLGNQVIITGRGQKALDETCAANPGMKSVTLDVSDPKSIQSFGAQVTKEFPSLNVLINMAGIMKPENLLEKKSDDLSTA